MQHFCNDIIKTMFVLCLRSKHVFTWFYVTSLQNYKNLKWNWVYRSLPRVEFHVVWYKYQVATWYRLLLFLERWLASLDIYIWKYIIITLFSQNLSPSVQDVVNLLIISTYIVTKPIYQRVSAQYYTMCYTMGIGYLVLLSMGLKILYHWVLLPWPDTTQCFLPNNLKNFIKELVVNTTLCVTIWEVCHLGLLSMLLKIVYHWILLPWLDRTQYFIIKSIQGPVD